MRILTVRQPWAWAIVHGGKDVENRPRNIAGGYRGPIAIHAGLAYDRDSHERSRVLRAAQDAAAIALGAEVFPHGYTWDLDAPDPRGQWSVMGAIIGVVDLYNVHDLSEEAHGADDEAWAQNCSPWAQWGDTGTAWHLMLRKPRPLAKPIPYTGALGLRNLATRDPEVVLEITRQIGRVS